eukprot:1743978-Amphidinium_carterae.1
MSSSLLWLYLNLTMAVTLCTFLACRNKALQDIKELDAPEKLQNKGDIGEEWKEGGEGEEWQGETEQWPGEADGPAQGF